MEFVNEIELLRRKTASVALEKGFTSCESIALSQELDRLLNLYSNKSLSFETEGLKR
ncbi:aspartyl-phosphate phosphatase Spo0E family protein [Virgibacillus halophilus]|uniref:Aspartyl-phosphate phosphatase Spo0E family protein n=1 Tax=Tigheibacillus halophilus TaxID=361280 RepID=A0ABU5CBJ2_9BACI|nr:aspartyl-phosphate phosphatase Spo0E family protein [Virgibacillus halophilus]